MTDATERPYEYETLKHQDSIRLIELFPGQRGTPLSCKFLEVRKGDNPTYEAVSYAWGAPLVRRCIRELDSNVSIHITENLFDGLQALRLQDKSRILWVDAISIDQTNPEEKIHQIAQMGAIYRDAIRVLVWLGREHASTIISFYATYEYVSRISSASILDEIGTLVHDPDSYGPEAYGIDFHFSRMTAFFQQAWFDRVWVVQEFVLARELKIYAGSCSFSYELFCEAVHGVGTIVDLQKQHSWEDNTQHQHKELTTAVILVRDLIRIREQRQAADLGGGPLPTLYQCCYISRKRKCSIIHDQLYGVLGLAGNDIPIKVDYTYPITQLWIDLILKCLEGGDLSPLHHAGFSQGSGIDTYIIQAFIPPFEALGNKPLPLAGKSAFCAGNSTSAKVEVMEFDLVKIRGITIDIVTQVAFHTEKPKHIQQWCDTKIFSQFGEWIFTYPTSPYRTEDLMRVIMRTEAAGVLPTDHLDNESDPTSDWVASHTQHMYNRVFFLTRKGYIGIGPYGMQEGDEVAIFDGDSTPFVLRADESGSDRWKLVGECYLDGWMYGDLFGHTVVESEGEESTSQDVRKYAEEEIESGVGEAKSKSTLPKDKGDEGKVLKRTSFILC
jgi:hypothetical protein